MIRLVDVTVSRGANRVVDRLTLEIRGGRVFWVIGPNGAGKSSLLRVLAGLDRPREGAVRWVEPDHGTPLYFQSEMALPPPATVGDWDRLVAPLTGGAAPPTELRPPVGPKRRVGRLSTGERKRLLVDALLRRPGPLVLDEPFEHLSPDAKRELRRLLASRARDHVVVVATNQGTDHVARDGGLRLEAGHVTPVPGLPS